MMLFIGASAFSSCSLNYEISINENDSVIGITDAYYIPEDRYWPNLKTGDIDGKTTFEIEDVNSLSFYLPYYRYDYFDFEKSGDTLKIRDRNPETVDYRIDWHNVIFIFHTFDPIKEFNSNTRFVKQIDDHTFTVRKSIRHFKRGERVIDATVLFKSS
jgi:hypothetical protein